MRWVVMAAALALATSARAQTPPTLDGVFQIIKPDTPGCALGWRRGGAAPEFRAWGRAEMEHAVPITPDTIFEAGSVSKQFTAAAILILAREGKLSLSDDIRKHLPEMPDYGAPITVDMLLSHTAGLRDWGELMALAGWPRTHRVYSLAETLQIASRQRALNHAPGETFAYTNISYNLATWIVQRVSGQSLAAFTEERLFKPLGMTRTGWRDNFRRITPGRAVAYSAIPGGFAQEMPFENTYGHGGLLTTVGDLLIWNAALTDGRLGEGFDAELRERPTVAGGRKIAYGRGLITSSWRGWTEVSHSGATASYRAWLARYPDQGLSVALLCNRGDASPEQIGHRVVEALGGPPAPPAAAPATPAGDLAALPGVYVDERAGRVLQIEADGRTIGVRGGAALRWASPGRYRGPDAEFLFAPDGVERRSLDGEARMFLRKAPADPKAPLPEGVAGAYSSPEAGAVLFAAGRDGRLVLTPSDRPSAPRVLNPLYGDAWFADGVLARLLRGPDGAVTGIRLSSGWVWALDFRRVPGS
jgi:CubicO group peptidase (beta-lactamase class C family)